MIKLDAYRDILRECERLGIQVVTVNMSRAFLDDLGMDVPADATFCGIPIKVR